MHESRLIVRSLKTVSDSFLFLQLTTGAALSVLEMQIEEYTEQTMINIRHLKLAKYGSTDFEECGNFVFKDLRNGSCRTAMMLELEEGEDTQYPLQNLLEKYNVSISDYFEVNEENGVFTLSIEFEGNLCSSEDNLLNIQNLLEIAGKRVYSRKDSNDGVELFIDSSAE